MRSASSPSPASPTTSNPCASSSARAIFRKPAWSSTIKTLICEPDGDKRGPHPRYGYPHLHARRLGAVSVTLLFTDIEGSTRLVQELGDAYPETLEDHRARVRAAIAATGGEEIDCRGDEFSVAFASPDAAAAGA